MEKPLVIYHKISDSLDCTDGFAAAFIFWLHFKNQAEYFPAFYYNRIPLDFFKDRDVVFIDFSYPADYMDEIFRVANSMRVLDHHKTSMLEIGTRPYAQIELDKCGAQMAWEYLFADQPLPKLFHHIRDNDLGLREDPKTKPFIQRLRSIPTVFMEWDIVYENLGQLDYYNKFILDGRLLLSAHEHQCRTLAASAFPIVLGGVQGLAVNANKFYAHDVGDILAAQCGTFGASFYFRPDNCVEFSLTSREGFDVEKLAYRYKGGGHKTASGFSIPITSFASIVDLSNKNVSFYLALHSYIDEFCQQFVPESRSAEAISAEVSQGLAKHLDTQLGYVAGELEILVEVFKINEKTVLQQFMYRLAELLGLPKRDVHRKWYHKVFPYRVRHPISFDDTQISELLELSKINDTEETKNFVVSNLIETVKCSYEAQLLEDGFKVEITVRFPNSNFFLRHSMEI